MKGRLAIWYWAWHAQIALSSVAPVVVTLKDTTQRMSCKRPLHIAAEKSLLPPKRAKHSRLQWMRAGAKGWAQEGEHSAAETQAVVKVRVRPPKGHNCPEKSIDRDVIPKVSGSICRCRAQRHSADRNDGMSIAAGKGQEGQEEDGTFSKWEERKIIYAPIPATASREEHVQTDGRTQVQDFQMGDGLGLKWLLPMEAFLDHPHPKENRLVPPTPSFWTLPSLSLSFLYLARCLSRTCLFALD